MNSMNRMNSRKCTNEADKPTKAVKRRTPAPIADPSTDAARPPQNPEELHAWVSEHLEINIARRSLIEGNRAPFDYLVHTFFEGRFQQSGEAWTACEALPDSPPDCVVWANRGGGKTFMGAVATLLDLVFKHGVEVRILAGSLEQSTRMYEHLRGFFSRPKFASLLESKITSRRIKLLNGSCARLLAASQPSVRGTRVQKVRCDEVDTFDPEIWKAAQLTTRELAGVAGPWGPSVRGSIEALSTMHHPYGLMWEIVTGERLVRVEGVRRPRETIARRSLFRWCVLDVLEHCPDHRECATCGLMPECNGKAKQRTPECAGHLMIDDALAQKKRVDLATWNSEMLCSRPRRTDAVYPEFEVGVHVVGDPHPRVRARAPVAYVAGMDFGFRAETVVLLASIDNAGTVLVEREHVATGLTTADHIKAIDAWLADGRTMIADPNMLQRDGFEWIAIDPAGRARNDQTAKSNYELLRNAGYRVRCRALRIGDGVSLVRTRLAPALNDGPNPEDCVPRLLVHERCERLIECMQRYRYPDNTLDSTEPCKKEGFDHACDALRYMLVGLDRPARVRVDEYIG